MAKPRQFTHQYTILDIIAHLLTSDPNVQRYLSYYHANQHRIVDAVLNDILEEIDDIVESPNPNTITQE